MVTDYYDAYFHKFYGYDPCLLYTSTAPLKSLLRTPSLFLGYEIVIRKSDAVKRNKDGVQMCIRDSYEGFRKQCGVHILVQNLVVSTSLIERLYHVDVPVVVYSLSLIHI